jgi:hypothetical protein
MKTILPLMIQDPTIKQRLKEKIPTLEGFTLEEDFLLDGPISRQVAVLDFSPETGELIKGAKWIKPSRYKLGWYENEQGKRLDKHKKLIPEELTTPAFLKVNVFATVRKTMQMFQKEEKEKTQLDILGRPLTWANGSSQLLVIPRAGRMKNAFYNRETNSLQFFMFSPKKNPNQTSYTSLFRDIVSHETGHAIVDGIAPDLFNAQQTQGLAIHESIADLTALLMAISSKPLREAVLKETNGNLKDSTDFSTIAEDWNEELKEENEEPKEGNRQLRNLLNEKSLDPESENCIKSNECHELSEVLSGALYKVFIKIHEDYKDELEPLYAKDPKCIDPRYSCSGWALKETATRFKQMIFRALDYLPPGDVDFIDYGRAIVAADTIGYPIEEDKRTSKIRNWIKTEFYNRKITEDVDELEVNTFFEHEALKNVNVRNICKSDWAAYKFADDPKTRSLLCIPPEIPFEVLPRLEVKKRSKPNAPEMHECIFKVAWDPIENNPVGYRTPTKRRVRVGTTLSLYWENALGLALLTSAPPHKTNTSLRYATEKQPQLAIDEYEKKQDSRTNFYKALAQAGLLKFNQHSLGPDGQPLLSCIQAENMDDIMRIKGAGKMLHIIGE